MSLWQSKRQEARVKRVWAILHFFTQFGFIVFTYLRTVQIYHDMNERNCVVFGFGNNLLSRVWCVRPNNLVKNRFPLSDAPY
ncbi:MAG: hypothetical protein HEQ20_13230 [Aphanizomenon flos-aquae KM1D3_PB]|uniref:hypothetical protein n=1 Tax=Aphanizomenon flos-aquae TaxID=1176 RepID=UPI0013642AED|nr:hypothetical protein [Aphanizomenon flos-aquae]QSV71537.1 MAG: hypothetical protein HEQ20_13230 [Aphanizomenon flos-aquae KM1D3_PB]